MNFENEITVKVNCTYPELTEILRKKGFHINRELNLKDSYMFLKGASLEKEYKLLSDYLIVRNVDNKEFQITHKYKEYDADGAIIRNGKTNCDVYDENTAIRLLEEIGYNRLFIVDNEVKKYVKDNIELVAAKVNNEYICIEYSAEEKSIEELIEEFKKFEIPYDDSDYFLNKSLIELRKLKENNQ